MPPRKKIKTKMNLTNKILFAAIVFAFALSVSGSAKTPYEKITGLKGIVRDSGTHEPVEFVTVALADTSGTVIAGATTDSTGRYSMDLSGITSDCRLLFGKLGCFFQPLNIEIQNKSVNRIGKIAAHHLEGFAKLL